MQNNFKVSRPLLNVHRFEIRQFVRFWKLPIYSDQSNQKTNFLRNKIRKQLMPVLRMFFNPQIDTVLLNFVEIKKNEQLYFENVLSFLLKPQECQPKFEFVFSLYFFDPYQLNNLSDFFTCYDGVLSKMHFLYLHKINCFVYKSNYRLRSYVPLQILQALTCKVFPKSCYESFCYANKSLICNQTSKYKFDYPYLLCFYVVRSKVWACKQAKQGQIEPLLYFPYICYFYLLYTKDPSKISTYFTILGLAKQAKQLSGYKSEKCFTSMACKQAKLFPLRGSCFACFARDRVTKGHVSEEYTRASINLITPTGYEPIKKHVNTSLICFTSTYFACEAWYASYMPYLHTNRRFVSKYQIYDVLTNQRFVCVRSKYGHVKASNFFAYYVQQALQSKVSKACNKSESCVKLIIQYKDYSNCFSRNQIVYWLVINNNLVKRLNSYPAIFQKQVLKTILKTFNKVENAFIQSSNFFPYTKVVGFAPHNNVFISSNESKPQKQNARLMVPLQAFTWFAYLLAIDHLPYVQSKQSTSCYAWMCFACIPCGYASNLVGVRTCKQKLVKLLRSKHLAISNKQAYSMAYKMAYKSYIYMPYLHTCKASRVTNLAMHRCAYNSKNCMHVGKQSMLCFYLVRSKISHRFVKHLSYVVNVKRMEHKPLLVRQPMPKGRKRVSRISNPLAKHTLQKVVYKTFKKIKQNKETNKKKLTQLLVLKFTKKLFVLREKRFLLFTIRNLINKY